MNKLKLTLLSIALLSAQGCSFTTTMGENDEWLVHSSTQLFAPSVTVVEKVSDGYIQTIGGQSMFSQVSGPAASAVGMYFIGQGLGDSGISTTNSTSTTNNLQSNSLSGSTSSSRSNSLSGSSINLK